jgi:hypothetical protein
MVPLPRDLRVKRHEDEQRAGVNRFFSTMLEFSLRGRNRGCAGPPPPGPERKETFRAGVYRFSTLLELGLRGR